jgi:hypothetical protein
MSKYLIILQKLFHIQRKTQTFLHFSGLYLMYCFWSLFARRLFVNLNIFCQAALDFMLFVFSSLFNSHSRPADDNYAQSKQEIASPRCFASAFFAIIKKKLIKQEITVLKLKRIFETRIAIPSSWDDNV